MWIFQNDTTKIHLEIECPSLNGLPFISPFILIEKLHNSYISFMANRIYRCYIFSEEQENFLRSKKYKIDRMECFMTLAERAVLNPAVIDISDYRQIVLSKGQLLITEVELAHLWKVDSKTVGKLIRQMENLKLLTTTKVSEVRVYSLHVLSGWYIDGVFQRNDFYLKPIKSWEAEKPINIPEIRVIIKTQTSLHPP